MDVSFIKKEEPVDYALIYNNEDQTILNENVCRTVADKFHSVDSVVSFFVNFENSVGLYVIAVLGYLYHKRKRRTYK